MIYAEITGACLTLQNLITFFGQIRRIRNIEQISEKFIDINQFIRVNIRQLGNPVELIH